jgi:hypothetical protein
MFQEIELFLQTFPDDDNIDEASIDLVVAAFAAIESVIGFLIQSIREFCLFLSLRVAQRTLWNHFLNCRHY